MLHGRDEPLAQLRTLCAGPLTAALDGVDLRYVKLGEVELVRRIYVAVRDRNWNTIPGGPAHVEVECGEDSFDVRFHLRHTSHDTDFSWEGSIAGTPEGRISFRMDGRGEREMHYNRIGFCVLHPWRESAGRPFRAQTQDGTVTGTLPLLVGPQRFEQGVYVPLFPSASRLEIDLASGGSIGLEFEGDLFETEDQRNWTDASFKTYCTPLALGFPHALKQGERIMQTVTAYTQPDSSGAARSREPGWRAGGKPGKAPVRAPRSAPRLEVGAPTGARVPAVGLALPAAVREPSEAEAELLRELRPAHVRVELHLGDAEWVDTLGRALATARTLHTQLELALFLRPEQEQELASVRDALAGAELARVLVAPEGAQTVTGEETTPPQLVRLVRDLLALTSVPVAGGTDMYFCELNRTRPRARDMDGIFWSLNPQVHAFDDVSLLETAEAQGEQVRAAREFAPGKALFVGPVTLKRRYNVNATVAEEAAAGELPDSVDPRQPTLIGAAWTLASAKHLAEQGASAITYFETVGWRGVVQGDDRPPVPNRFPARAGDAFPLFHVLADIAELRSCALLECATTRPLEVAALAAIRGGGAMTLLVANLTPGAQAVELPGLDGEPRIRRLNEDTAERAMLEPQQFRAGADCAAVAALTLAPYETVRIDS